MGHPRVPWVIPTCCGSSPHAMVPPRVSCVVPACCGSSPPAMGYPHMSLVVSACHGSSPPAVVCPLLPWFVPSCHSSSPPAVFCPTCPSFIRACQPSFMPVSYIVSRVVVMLARVRHGYTMGTDFLDHTCTRIHRTRGRYRYTPYCITRGMPQKPTVYIVPAGSYSPTIYTTS